jgi:hypothetical protein
MQHTPGWWSRRAASVGIGAAALALVLTNTAPENVSRRLHRPDNIALTSMSLCCVAFIALRHRRSAR